MTFLKVTIFRESISWRSFNHLKIEKNYMDPSSSLARDCCVNHSNLDNGCFSGSVQIWKLFWDTYHYIRPSYYYLLLPG